MWSLLCVPSLAAMALSDLRSRRVEVVHLAILFVTLLAASLIESGWRTVAFNVASNLLTAAFLWLSLRIYSGLRRTALREMLGGGDIAFAIVVTPFFGIREYVVFLIVSCLLTLAVWWVSGFRNGRCREIPLVTGMGACLGAVIIYRVIVFLI